MLPKFAVTRSPAMKVSYVLLPPRSALVFCAALVFFAMWCPEPLDAAEPVDRGPTFSGTIRAHYPNDNNTTMKGIVVALGQQTNAFICYDTDLMRVSLEDPA